MTAADVLHSYEQGSSRCERLWLLRSRIPRKNGGDIPEPRNRPSLRVFRWIAEHLDEEGRGEGVETIGGLCAQASDAGRPVQDAGNPPLLIEGREKNFERFQIVFPDRDKGTSLPLCD